VELDGIAQRVVASDRNNKVNPEILQVFHDFFGEVIELLFVFIPEVDRDIDIGDVTGPGAGSMEKSPAGTADLVDDLLGQELAAL
jgi:hypothetical protein